MTHAPRGIPRFSTRGRSHDEHDPGPVSARLRRSAGLQPRCSPGRPLSAQACDAGAPSRPLPPLLRRMVDAVNAADSAALAALYTEDGIHEDIPAGVKARAGRRSSRSSTGRWVSSATCDSSRCSAARPATWRCSNTTFSVTDLATGRPIAYRGVLVFELDGDLIRRSADYYDLTAILGQLAPGAGQPPRRHTQLVTNGGASPPTRSLPEWRGLRRPSASEPRACAGCW